MADKPGLDAILQKLLDALGFQSTTDRELAGASVEYMADTSTRRPEIDPILKMLLDAVPLEFTIDDGVEVARERLRSVKPPPELLPAMRIEARTIEFGDVAELPVRIY